MLARVARDSESAEAIARRAGFPPEYLPAFRTAAGFWGSIVEQAALGRIGLEALVGEALRQFPHNPELGAIRERIIKEAASRPPPARHGPHPQPQGRGATSTGAGTTPSPSFGASPFLVSAAKGLAATLSLGIVAALTTLHVQDIRHRSEQLDQCVLESDSLSRSLSSVRNERLRLLDEIEDLRQKAERSAVSPGDLLDRISALTDQLRDFERMESDLFRRAASRRRALVIDSDAAGSPPESSPAQYIPATTRATRMEALLSLSRTRGFLQYHLVEEKLFQWHLRHGRFPDDESELRAFSEETDLRTEHTMFFVAVHQFVVTGYYDRHMRDSLRAAVPDFYGEVADLFDALDGLQLSD